MGEKRIIVEVECLLKNGREVWLTLELPRDSVAESDGVVTYTRRPEDGLVEEHVIPRAEVAYLRQLTREVPEGTGIFRTLGQNELVPSS
jgi:hypothetical protein